MADEKQQSESWDKYEDRRGFIKEGFPFDEGFPSGGPFGNASKSYELIVRDGERVKARVNYDKQYSAEGIQWRTTGGRTLGKGVVAAWREFVRKKLLIADDDREYLEVLSNKFIKEGYDVVLAENGAEALEQYRDGNFDALVLDNNMPQMTGLEAIAELAKDDSMPIVVLHTAAIRDKDGNDVQEIVKKHGAYYFSKGFSMGPLVSYVKTLIPPDA